MAKYSKELLKKTCDLIKKGLSNKDAVICMGISESTFYQWQTEKPEFSESLKKAEMERKSFLITRIFEASNKSWQAAAWYLERTYPNEFGKQEKKVEIEEPKGFNELYLKLNEENRKIASHLIQKLREEMKVIRNNINQN